MLLARRLPCVLELQFGYRSETVTALRSSVLRNNHLERSKLDNHLTTLHGLVTIVRDAFLGTSDIDFVLPAWRMCYCLSFLRTVKNIGVSTWKLVQRSPSLLHFCFPLLPLPNLYFIFYCVIIAKYNKNFPTTQVRWNYYSIGQLGAYNSRRPPSYRHVLYRKSSWEYANCIPVLGGYIPGYGYTPLPQKAYGEDTLDAVVYLTVAEECPTLRTRPTHSASSPCYKYISGEHISSIQSLVEDAFVRFIGDVGKVTISGPERTVVVVIDTVVNKTEANVFRSISFYTSTEKAVQKWIARPQTVNAVVTRMIIAPISSILAAKYIRQ